MAEHLEPAAEEVEMAGNARRLFNAFVQVGFPDAQAFDLTRAWFDRTVDAALRSLNPE